MADPDLQIREGPGYPDPEIRGARSQKNISRPFGSHFGLKMRGGEGGSPGPSPGSAMVMVGQNFRILIEKGRVCNSLAEALCIV